ncbi:PREDICTED: probable disease resistance protein At4g33300 [Tarenaya hassleriana]|uniref:probable disease resistance protein At4g33300 n=1 Tax=Tarenaya hassleriana TaxID=28532 RepID=UPI00053CA0F4|nr:PREDICTED: probable disease resistance protein At4g33300 [Tarenaya hassleriana]
MAVTDFFVGEIATELVKQLFLVSMRACKCKTSAESLRIMIEDHLPTIKEIQYSGVELPEHRQFQIDTLRQTLVKGQKLAEKILSSHRWNMVKQLYLARKMEKIENTVSRFLQGPLITQILADVHHLRADASASFDRIDKNFNKLSKQIASMKIGGGGLVVEAMKRAEMTMDIEMNGELGNLGVGLELGKRKVKEMIFDDKGGIAGITGMGGSGKTTLARELERDDEIRRHFDNRVLFLTVSQSPNLDELRSLIWGFLSGCEALHPADLPEWNFQFEYGVKSRALVILDDVWTIEALNQLTFKIPGCTTLVVSRSKFTGPSATYHVELLRKEEAMSLFCLCAFGQKSVPPAFSENLVKQIVDECKGLPLALKVIGASLKDRPQKYWEGAAKRLSRGEPADEAHESSVLDQIATSLENLDLKSRECFMDLGAFPEDKKIPLDVLINMWVGIHDIEEEEAFKVLVDLSDKNLLTLVKDPRLGASYTSYYDIFVTQHDVLRDLALHLSGRGKANRRQRLLMPKRDSALPREWERNNDEPYNALIVSFHTGEMDEMDWFDMEFPKAEVLILNFSSDKYFLPPFISKMRKLRALVIINNGMSPAVINDFSVFSDLTCLRSLWLERVHVPELSNSTIPLENLRKMSLILCKVNNSFAQKELDISKVFPRLYDLTIDHCDDLIELPTSICGMKSLHSLSVTNCHRLCELPKSLGKLQALQILRLYACPELKIVPEEICELPDLKYVDISQCVNLTSLPKEIGNLKWLEKIDMRECWISGLPRSAVLLKSLRHVICDKDAEEMWDDVVKAVEGLYVEAAEKSFSLAWLDE